jgi:excisionase family DNA binding protein
MYTQDKVAMDLLTIQETAKLLKVTPTTVRRYITAGQLPAVKVGRGVRVRKEALETLLAPVTPRRPGVGASHTQEKGGPMRERERSIVSRLTEQDQHAVLAAIEQARRLRAELAAQRGGTSVPSSLELLDEAREQRTRELA